MQLDPGFADQLDSNLLIAYGNGETDPVLIDPHLAWKGEPSRTSIREKAGVTSSLGPRSQLGITSSVRAEKIYVIGLAVLVEVEHDPCTSAEKKPTLLEDVGVEGPEDLENLLVPLTLKHSRSFRSAR